MPDSLIETTGQSVGTLMRERLRNPPRRFQIRGVRFIEAVGGRGVVADDMGLGKTYQTIAWLVLHPEARPAVIVCPSTLKYNWQEELFAHGYLRSSIVQGTKPYRMAESIWIVNYEVLKHWREHLERQDPKVLVFDECQRISNRKAQCTQAAEALGQRCPHVIGLSGTPILNRPVEFFPILHLVAPQAFPSFWKYAFRYCDPKPGWRGRGWNFTGASNLEELHERVAPYMIRRLKKDVLPELPQRQPTVIPLDITNRREYELARDEFIKWVRKTRGRDAAKRARRAEAFTRMEALKQLAAQGKAASVASWITDFLDTGQKLVLFCTHHEVLQWYARMFSRECVVIEGATSLATRQAAVEAFQTSRKVRLLVGNIKAAGVGLTLTAASTTAHAELAWNPAIHDQADDRVLRIGQKASHVDAFYFVARDTVEEATLKLLNAKRSVISRVVDGHDSTDVRLEVLKQLSGGLLD